MRRLGSAANTDDRLDDEREFFDRLAELACEPDERFSELRETYLTDDRIRVPATVLNMLLDQRQAAR